LLKEGSSGSNASNAQINATGAAPEQEPLLVSIQPAQPAQPARRSYYSESGYQEKSDSPEWDAVMEAMAAEIRVRHYSRKTLKTYANWSRQFQRFLNC
jgi:hypothetical protein